MGTMLVENRLQSGQTPILNLATLLYLPSFGSYLGVSESLIHQLTQLAIQSPGRAIIHHPITNSLKRHFLTSSTTVNLTDFLKVSCLE
jgi:hypothetical protein